MTKGHAGWFVLSLAVGNVGVVNAQVNAADVSYVLTFEQALDVYRAQHGLAQLERNADIERVASHHADYLERLHSIKDNLLEATHGEYVRVEGAKALGGMEERFQYFGFYQGYGECVALFEERSLITPAVLLAEWQGSKPHDQLLRGRFTGYGLSVVHFERNGHVITVAVLTLTDR